MVIFNTKTLSEQDKKRITALRNVERACNGGWFFGYKTRTDVLNAAVARDLRKAIEKGHCNIQTEFMIALKKYNILSLQFLSDETKQQLDNAELIIVLSNASPTTVWANPSYTYEGKTIPRNVHEISRTTWH